MTLSCIPRPVKKSDEEWRYCIRNLRKSHQPTWQTNNFPANEYKHLATPVEQMAMITTNDSHQFTAHSCDQKLPRVYTIVFAWLRGTSSATLNADGNDMQNAISAIIKKKMPRKNTGKIDKTGA